MSREEMKELIVQVIQKLEDDTSEAPAPACLFSDNPDPCDMTTRYAIGEEG